MQIDSLRIQNYKGFSDSGEIQFGSGFNVLIGQNNSGKSALLEALRLTDTASVPHSSVQFERGAPLPPHSIFTALYSLTGQEFRRALILSQNVFFPIPDHATNFLDDYFNEVFSRDRIQVGFRASSSSVSEPLSYPSSGLFEVAQDGTNKHYSVHLNVRPDLQGFQPLSVQNRADDGVFASVLDEAKRRTYVFNAQRLNIGRYPAQEQNVLSPSASNLPAVLHNMQSNPARYDRFCAHVTEIFPNIRWVTVVTVGQEFEIRIWPVEKSSERDDMALSIMKGGTGVGQVLSILYVAMTMVDSIVAIDEPSNFLHPGAVKKLIGILNTYARNQYIIATHSTEAILASDPSTIHLIKWENGTSSVERVNVGRTDELKSTIAEIGASLSDLFGPDSIIWVEGETEQFCFPEICRSQLGGVPVGLSFLALRSTADVEQGNRNADKALALYEKVASIGAIIPPALAFSFDRELRTADDVRDLERRSRRTLVLGRRTIENYLISSGAIAHVLGLEMSENIAAEDVDSWITINRSQYFPPVKNRWDGDVWEHYVDAPRMLEGLFLHFSDARVEFRKTRHSLMLLSWRLEFENGELAELVDHVERLVAA